MLGREARSRFKQIPDENICIRKAFSCDKYLEKKDVPIFEPYRTIPIRNIRTTVTPLWFTLLLSGLQFFVLPEYVHCIRCPIHTLPSQQHSVAAPIHRHDSDLEMPCQDSNTQSHCAYLCIPCKDSNPSSIL